MSLSFGLSYAALWAIVIFQSLVLLGLVRMVYRLQPEQAVALPPQGNQAPPFEANDLNGRLVKSESFAGQLTALLFASPNCTTCMTTMAELEAVSRKVAGNLIVVCEADRDDCSLLVSRHELSQQVLVDDDGHIGKIFGISGTPTAVVIDERGRIQSVGNPMRADEMAALMEPVPGISLEPVGAQ